MRLFENSGTVFAEDLKVAVAAGQVEGWRRFRKFGMNDDVDSGGDELVWPPGGLKTYPTTAGVASIVSDSTDDDFAGTGARTLTVLGLDSNYDEVSETVQMDGTVPVVTTQTFLRLNRAFVQYVGTNSGTNIGNISISVGGALQAYVEVGEGQSHQCEWTVPADHIYMIDVYSIVSGKLGSTDVMDFQGQIRVYDEDAPLSDPYQAWRTISDIYMPEGVRDSTNGVEVFPAKTDIRVIVNTNGNNRRATAVVDGYLVRSDVLGSYLK